MNNGKILFLLSSIIILVGGLLIWFGVQPQETREIVNSTSSQPSSPLTEVLRENTQVEYTGIEGEKAFVTKVVDGDTIHAVINDREYTIRLLGVDTPETVDPRKSVQCFGKEASNETKKLLSGKEVILQKDVSDTDKYRRLLRFVFLPVGDGNYLFVDDYLIRQGFAKPLTIPPDVKYSEQFLEAAREAREGKRGLWEKC